jgi:hypothetical protein
MRGKIKIGLTSRLIICIIIGLIVGSVCGFVIYYDGSGLIEEGFKNYLNLKQKGSFFELTYSSFFPVASLVIINFFNGYSLLTGFIKYILSFSVGTAIGMMSVLLYQYANNGILFNLLLFIPTNVLFSGVIILSFRESEKLSVMCKKIVFYDEYVDNKDKLLKEYIFKLILLLSITFIVSLLSSVSNCIFFKFFTLFD